MYGLVQNKTFWTKQNVWWYGAFTTLHENN